MTDHRVQYFRVRRGPVAETRELSGGAVLADYNAKGELLGIEMLQEVNDLRELVRQHRETKSEKLKSEIAATIEEILFPESMQVELREEHFFE